MYNNGGAWRYEYYLKDHLGNIRLSFTDKNGNGVVDVTNTATNEILQENQYYPFGMDLSGPWMNDAAPDNRYKYNGKEYNDDFGLNWMDYGARWYDGAVGRWWSGDPLAVSYQNWSTYNYVMNNPTRLIDPDGKSVYDIIIGNKDLDKRWEAFGILKKLTNDELAMDSHGKVTISKKGGSNTDKILTEGTQLVSDLIADNNTTTIILDPNRKNEAFAVNETTNTEIRAEPREGVEYGANVYINGMDPATTNADGSRGLKGGSFITLGHELNHARDLVSSKFDRTILPPVIDFDPIPARQTDKFTKREFNTRLFENKLRKEQGLQDRALPLPVNLLKNIRF